MNAEQFYKEQFKQLIPVDLNAHRFAHRPNYWEELFAEIKLMMDVLKVQNKNRPSFGKRYKKINAFLKKNKFSFTASVWRTKHPNSIIFDKYIKMRLDEDYNQKQSDTCTARGCFHKYTTVCDGGRSRYCTKHAKRHQKLRDAQHERENKNKKDKAHNSAQEYIMYAMPLIKKLNLRNKKVCIQKIEDFYKSYSLVEPMFRILIIDLINLNGGDAQGEYPFWRKTYEHFLIMPRADILCRKYKMVIEIKAAFFEGNGQLMLDEQLIDYTENFPKHKVLGLSPDGVQPNAMTLLEFLKILIKKRGKK